VTAAQLVLKYGKKLVGKKVLTVPMGEWPGGMATVTEIQPDENAPDIVFYVAHVQPKIRAQFPSMGVFHYEECDLV
jgi:hypothetical protein